MWAYGGVLMAALAVVSLWTSADASILDIFTIAAPGLFVVAALWSAFAWWGFDRRWPSYALAACLLAAAPKFFMPVAPGLDRKDSAPPVVEVAFHNDWGKDEYASPIGAWANQIGVDVLGFIELTPQRYALIGPAIAKTYPFHIERAAGSRMALYSPYPIVRVEAPQAQAGPDLLIGDIALPAAKGGGKLRVALVHYRRPWPFDEFDRQRTQSLVMGRIVTDLEDVDIVFGDFNATPWSGQVRRLSEYADMPLLRGSSGTWPVAAPAFLRLPIDLMFVRQGGRGRVAIGQETGSAHRALVARVQLGKAP
jgi:endonuclease/exonuclease/phosphatase (EEP) superfamily protein YafD